jgi:hypothetical protein
MPDDKRGKTPQPAPALLWFLDDSDALLRRLIVRTLLEPPAALRRLRPRGRAR